MKTFLTLVAFASFGVAQTSPKPSDATIVAYFKADAALAAAKSEHDALMDNIKKALADSIAKQTNAAIQFVIANSQLRNSCPAEQQIDDQALKSGDVKCVKK
jgi:hypothetical protein